MKNISKLFALLVALCMMLTLCACGSTGNVEGKDETSDKTTTEPEVTEPEVTKPEETDPVIETVFTVSIVDNEGNAVPGVSVQVCDDEMCRAATSDENGIATFTTSHFEAVEDGYGFSLIICPAGYEYEYVGDNKLHLESGMTELEVVLTKVN